MCRELEIENEAVPRIASGFAGGIGGTGSVCGAVVGATMAFGLLRGRDALAVDPATPTDAEQDLRDAIETTGEDLPEEMDPSWRLAAEFRRRFEAEMGSIDCRDLTGADLTTDEGRGRYMASDAPATVCLPAVGTAYRLVMDLLQEPS